jgi:glucose/arabinose dehydrogenase
VHPNPNPPKPFVSLEPHAGPNGVDFSRSATFSFEGDAVITQLGITAALTGRPTIVRGFRVDRVDIRRRRVVPCAVNKIAGPASKRPHAVCERVTHCQSGPDGALCMVERDEIAQAPDAGAIRIQRGTGTLWFIRRTEGSRGERPT